MGWAEDDHGNIFALGSRTGRAFDPEGNRRQDGFILKIKPADDAATTSTTATTDVVATRCRCGMSAPVPSLSDSPGRCRSSTTR